MEMLSDGSYTIRDDVSIGGEGVSNFVFGRGWLLELMEIASGEFYFFSDSVPVRSRSNRFGIFYPSFTFVRSYVRDLKGKVHGVGATRDLPDLPTEPFIFETDFVGQFAAAEDVISILAEARDRQSIAVNTNPSPLSVKTKQLIDENYLAYPSIGRIAARLGVSHEHLTRQFKRDFQFTPSEYLHQLRIAEATFRLSTGEEIIDISQDVGYNDLSRFYKQFRKNTQTSPAQCRTMLNINSAAK